MKLNYGRIRQHCELLIIDPQISEKVLMTTSSFFGILNAQLFMPVLLFQISIYVLSFICVWVGAGFVVSSVSKLAHQLRLPPFLISFFLLGNLTSLPEIAIGINSIVTNDPVIYAGNLIGGVLVIFFGIIPLLAMVNGGVKMPKSLHRNEILLTLFVVFAPSLLIADQRFTPFEGILMILIYSLLFLFLSQKISLFDKLKHSLHKKKKTEVQDIILIVIGVILLFLASHQIVESTLYFAEVFTIPTFILSLVVVSIGTNIPELSIVFRSVFQKKQEIALADYLGSASANTLLFGVFTLIYGKTVVLPNHFWQRFTLLVLGLFLFYFFSRSRNTISRIEAAVLLIIYCVFVWMELSVGLE